MDKVIVRRGDGDLSSSENKRGSYRKRSRHASASNGYKTLAEQTYGEQDHTKIPIFPKNTPITHPVRTISLANSFTTGISFNNALDTDSAGISANLSSSNPTTSGVRFAES